MHCKGEWVSALVDCAKGRWMGGWLSGLNLWMDCMHVDWLVGGLVDEVDGLLDRCEIGVNGCVNIGWIMRVNQ